MAVRNVEYIIGLRDNFSRKLSVIDKNLQTTGKRIQAVGVKLSLAVTLPIVALGVAVVKVASDFEETESKFNTVFSSIRQQANDTAKNLKNNFGLSSRAALQLLGDTGDLLVGFGFTESAALKMSKQVNELAVDLASFTNVQGGAQSASIALTKALLGERESIKTLGISILESDVKARVLLNTQKGLRFESVRQAKAVATLQLATEQSSKAIGDFERTSQSFANQMRITRARLEDLGIQIGKILLPVAQKLLKIVKGWIDRFSKLSPETKKLIVVIAGLAAALGPLLIALGFLTSTIIPALITGFALLTGPIGLIILGITALTIGIIAFGKAENKIIQIQKKFNKLLIEEKTNALSLFLQLKNTNIGTAKRSKLITEINSKYGKFLRNHLDEKSRLEDINKAQKLVIQGIKDSIIARATAAKQQSIITEQLNREEIAIAKLSEFRQEKFAALLGGQFGDVEQLIKGFKALRGTAGELQQELFEKVFKGTLDVTLKQIQALDKLAAGTSTVGGNEKKNLDILINLVEKRKEDEKTLNRITKTAAALSGIVTPTTRTTPTALTTPTQVCVTSITSAAPKVFNITIENLVETLNINSTTVQGGAVKMKEAITTALLTVLSDVQIQTR